MRRSVISASRLRLLNNALFGCGICVVGAALWVRWDARRPDIVPGVRTQSKPTVRPRPALNTADQAAITYLADQVERGERRLTHVRLHYRVAGIAFGRSIARTASWATSGTTTRYDAEEADPRWPNAVSQLRIVTTGQEGATWRRTRQGQSIQGTQIDRWNIDAESDSENAREYLIEASLWRYGQPLSQIIRSRAVAINRKGNSWIVTLYRPTGAPGKDELVLRGDRDYRPERWTADTPSDQSQRERAVTRWIGGGKHPWLPGTIVSTTRIQERELAHFQLTVDGAEFTRLPPFHFNIPDDSDTPVWDRSLRRWTREPKGKMVPVTDERLESTVRALTTESASSESIGKVTRVHDNGARSNINCGLHCVWVLSRLLGKAPSWDGLLKRFPSKDGAHSMLEITQAAADCGVKLTGFEVPFRAAAAEKVPFIVRLKMGSRDHFCVVTEWTSDRVRMYNPPGVVYDLPPAAIGPDMWGAGYVLRSSRSN